MPKRSRITLADIADWRNLMHAFNRAAKGAGNKRDVMDYARHLETNIQKLRYSLLHERWRVGQFRHFHIRDPKPRLISAPIFEERVLHHALIARIGPILDKALVDDSFACRKGKGTVAAVQRVQHHLRRFPFFVQFDINSYFASIDHQTLIALLSAKFKDAGLLRLINSIVESYHLEKGKGLPLGSLCSQQFANYYLNTLDRKLLEDKRSSGLVRYMDDVLVVTSSLEKCHGLFDAARHHAEKYLKLKIKPNYRIAPSTQGTLFCGFRVLPGAVLLSRRRRRGYSTIRHRSEKDYVAGNINAVHLQQFYAAALGLCRPAETQQWRRLQLERLPLAESVEDA